jgi:predicted PurR-regulated permease PerM
MEGLQPNEIKDAAGPGGAPDAAGQPHHDDALLVAEISFRRDRLLAALPLIAGAGLVLAVPFALRAGAEFFLPVTAALVIAIALVPLLEWLERRGLPSSLAAFACLLLFIIAANIAIASIVLPAGGRSPSIRGARKLRTVSPTNTWRKRAALR